MRKPTPFHQALHAAERAARYIELRLMLAPAELSTVSRVDVERVADALAAARLALLNTGTAHPYTPKTEA